MNGVQWGIMLIVALLHAPAALWGYRSTQSLSKFMQWASCILGILSPLIGKALANLTMSEMPAEYAGIRSIAASMFTWSLAISGFSGHILWYAVWKAHGAHPSNNVEGSDSARRAVGRNERVTPQLAVHDCLVCGRETDSVCHCVALHKCGFVCNEVHVQERLPRRKCELCEMTIRAGAEPVMIYVDGRLYESAIHPACHAAYVSSCDDPAFRQKLIARLKP
jgi:hypothetical protein